jgi:hypothetical protein
MNDANAGLDIRWPIGLMFSGIGAAVGCYGIFSRARAEVLGRSVNVNLWWGVVMLAFGLAMIWGGVRAGKKKL